MLQAVASLVNVRIVKCVKSWIIFFGYQFQEPSFSVGRKQPLYFDCGLF